MFDTITAYTYQAEQVCEPCMRKKACMTSGVIGANSPESTEILLDRWAADEGIDRTEKTTFDTDDFPKIIFESSIECCERCDVCNETLNGGAPCVTYPHNWTLGGRGMCGNGRCRTLGSGDPCNDGDCLYHPDNPAKFNCPEFDEFGSCIHSDHMMAAGL